MKYIRSGLLAVLLLHAATGEGADFAWTQCAKVVSVVNYVPLSGEVFVTLSPAPSGCNGEILHVPSTIPFRIGKNGVNASNIVGLLDAALAAYSSGHKVLIAYDPSAPECFGAAIALGGTKGDCP
jgi:hypothetical protein